MVFDLDGTLVDSAPDIAAAANAALARMGRPQLDLATIRRFIGDGAPKLMERVMGATAADAGQPIADDAPLSFFLEAYAADPSSRSRAFPDVAPTLARLRDSGITLGICTNKPLDLSQALLRDLELDGYFEVVVGGECYPTKKPSPEPVVGVFARLGVEPATGAFVGDAETDSRSARAAGVGLVLLMRHGYARMPLETLENDGLLDGFAQLPHALGL